MPFKITVFQMLMENLFLQNDALIETFNLLVLFVIGNFTWYTLSGHTLSLFSVFDYS